MAKNYFHLDQPILESDGGVVRQLLLLTIAEELLGPLESIHRSSPLFAFALIGAKSIDHLPSKFHQPILNIVCLLEVSC
jgi:hypothetical protein